LVEARGDAAPERAEISLGCKERFYFDYNLDKKERSFLRLHHCLYPLWAGIASPEQAHALVKSLSKLEQPGGLVMSPYETEGQWTFLRLGAHAMIAMEGSGATVSTTMRTGFPTTFEYARGKLPARRNDSGKYNAVTDLGNCRQSRLQHQRRRIWMDKRGIRRISA